MRIQAQYNFYFDFLLPRLDEPLALHIVNPPYEAFIDGWNRVEPLFLDEIGQSLASAQLSVQSAEFPNIRQVHRVRDICIDRLRVVIEWDADSPLDENITTESLNRAVRYADLVLDHLRVVARAPLAHRIERHWRLGDSRFEILIPHTETWINKDDDSFLLVHDGHNSTFLSGALFAPETGSTTSAEFAASILADKYPSLPLSLFVDAETNLMSLSVRKAILDIASACEVAASRYIGDQTLITKTAAKNAMAEGSFATKYYDKLPQAVCSRSFRQEDESAFLDVDAVYSQRNGLMHGGQLREDFAALDEVQQYHKVYEWLGSARRAVEWVGSLPR